jgi:hypothetical protein
MSHREHKGFNPKTQAAIEDGMIYQALSRRGILAMAEDFLMVAEEARAVAKSAKCRITDGASPGTKGDALVPKDKLNRLKRKLRKLAPGCLGKE